MEHALFTVTVIFSLVTGTVAGVLLLLTWEILRRTTFGRAVFALSIAMVLFAFYHALLLVVRSESLLTDLFRSGIFTGMAVAIGLLVHLQHSLEEDSTGP